MTVRGTRSAAASIRVNATGRTTDTGTAARTAGAAATSSGSPLRRNSSSNKAESPRDTIRPFTIEVNLKTVLDPPVDLHPCRGIDTKGEKAGRCPSVTTMTGWIEARCQCHNSNRHHSEVSTIAGEGDGTTSVPGAEVRRVSEETAAGFLRLQSRPIMRIVAVEAAATGIAVGGTTDTAAAPLIPRLRATVEVQATRTAAHPAPIGLLAAMTDPEETAIDLRTGIGTFVDSSSPESAGVILVSNWLLVVKLKLG
jgi:hypothetical protein